MSKDTVYDKAFHRTFSEPRNAAGVLRDLVPSDLAQMIQWDTLRLASEKYVNDLLRERRSDLVYQAELAGRSLFIYLVEHQSSVDPLMCIRLYTAIGQLWDAWRREHPDASLVPAVLPLVVYHGDSAWTAAAEVSELIDLPSNALKALSDYLPQQRYILDDLSTATPESIRQRQHLTAAARLTLAALQFLRRQCDDPVGVLSELWPLVEELRRLGPRDDFWIFVRYIGQVVRNEHREEVWRYMQDHLSEGEYGKFISIEEATRLEGAHRILKNQLRIKFGGELPNQVIDRLERATEEQLDRWSERVLTAATLDEIFQ